MTEWVLIVMMCGRYCTPTYAEVFPTKEACAVHAPAPPNGWTLRDKYCVPLIKTKQ